MSANAIDSVRHTGHVKFFNSVKGFGFIIPDKRSAGNENEEVFVHHTAIYNNGGFKSLAEGEEVEYDIIQGPKGMQASNVTGPDGSPVKGDPRAPYHRNQMSGSGGYRRNNYSQANYSNIYTTGGIYLDHYGIPISQYGDMPMWAGLPPYHTNTGNLDQQSFAPSPQQQSQAGSNSNSSSHHQGFQRLPAQYHAQQQFLERAYPPPPMFRPGPPQQQQSPMLQQPQAIVPPHASTNTPMFLYADTPPFHNANKGSGAASPTEHVQQQKSPVHEYTEENSTT